MPYKIKKGISPRPAVSEAADFMEVNSWLNGSYSAMALQNEISRESDQIDNEGLEDEDTEIEEFSLKVLTEIQRRIESSAGLYPFELIHSGTVLQPQEESDQGGKIYVFLLLATRLSMDVDKVQAGLDGTQIFERISAIALRYYLGSIRAKSFVFGTSVSGSFRDKINDLCLQIGEGGRYSQPDETSPPANDDGLDVVGWIPFEDCRQSQITIFGQCKTGTNWRKEISRLNPTTFTAKWMSSQFCLPPSKAYFVTEAADEVRWNETSYDAHLFFDRCRVMACISGVHDDAEFAVTLSEAGLWSEAALASASVSG